MNLRDHFSRAAMNGPQMLTMSLDQRRRILRECLQRLDAFDECQQTAGERAMALILQPLFALSGYKLKAEPVEKGTHRFDLVATNFIGGDDRILVDFTFNRDALPRSMVPAKIHEMLASLGADDPTRIIMVSASGYQPRTIQSVRERFGPRLELWSFDDVRLHLKALGEDIEGHRMDIVARLVLDFVEKLALAIARAQAELRHVEWRALEQMMGPCS